MEVKLLVRDDDDHPIALVDVRRCDSLDHEPRLATQRLRLAVDYCDHCAAWMLRVGEVLGGTHVHVEDIPCQVPQQRRAIDMTMVSERARRHRPHTGRG